MNVVVTGIGNNLASIRFALERLGVDAIFTDESRVIQRASRVILPGVGTAGCAMHNLRQRGLVEVLQQLTVPVLGICVGMQILMARCDEDDTTTLGIIPGRVERLLPSVNCTVPHMGWNTLESLQEPSRLLSGITSGSYVYFVHSYAVRSEEYALAVSQHGERFAAVVAKDNFYGVQFHPERSAGVGEKFLQNFFTM